MIDKTIAHGRPRRGCKKEGGGGGLTVGARLPPKKSSQNHHVECPFFYVRGFFPSYGGHIDYRVVFYLWGIFCACPPPTYKNFCSRACYSTDHLISNDLGSWYCVATYNELINCKPTASTTDVL